MELCQNAWGLVFTHFLEDQSKSLFKNPPLRGIKIFLLKHHPSLSLYFSADRHLESLMGLILFFFNFGGRCWQIVVLTGFYYLAPVPSLPPRVLQFSQPCNIGGVDELKTAMLDLSKASTPQFPLSSLRSTLAHVLSQKKLESKFVGEPSIDIVFQSRCPRSTSNRGSKTH